MRTLLCLVQNRRYRGHHAKGIQGLHVAQVSRLFSALLQLANNGNVALLRGAAPADPFRLRLLRLARPGLAGFRAPSCLQARCRSVRVIIGSRWVSGKDVSSCMHT